LDFKITIISSHVTTQQKVATKSSPKPCYIRILRQIVSFYVCGRVLPAARSGFAGSQQTVVLAAQHLVDFFVQMPDLKLGFQIDFVIGSENFAAFRVFGGLQDIPHGETASWLQLRPVRRLRLRPFFGNFVPPFP
jgi:hypothetical protein